MKRFYILLILCISMFFIPNTYALEVTDVHSNEALVVNMNTDEVLFSKNTEDGQVPIASLTKLMTYAVVMDEADDVNNTMVTIPDGLTALMTSKGASVAGVSEQYQYSVKDLLYGMMVPSGCDAAEALAVYYGGGDSNVFVQKMNAKAQALGMTNTIFVDSYGIGVPGVDSKSTEGDLYLLIKYVSNLPYFRDIVSTEYYEITGEKDGNYVKNTVRNTDYLVGEYSGEQYYYPYSIGGKTGNLDVAGRCLITIADKDDLEVAVITLGVPYEFGSNYDYHLTDHIKLLDYVFESFTENITIDIGPEYRSMEIGKQHQIEATTSEDTTITWESSDPSIATVDSNGIVTGISQGQTKVTATTSTGNVDYTFVSVNFYNGVQARRSSGKKNGNDYDPVDFSIIKAKGIDYAIIRACHGTTVDSAFYNSYESASNAGMNIGIWFEAYAETEEEVIQEANKLLEVFNNIDTSYINLPIFYNLQFYSSKKQEDVIRMYNVFRNILNSHGYEVILEEYYDVLGNMTQDALENEVGAFSSIYRVAPPDLKTTLSVNGVNTSFWNYKTSPYFGSEFGTGSYLSLMYMDYKKINTIHKEYIAPKNEEGEEEVVVINTAKKEYNSSNTIIIDSLDLKEKDKTIDLKGIDTKPLAEKGNRKFPLIPWIITIVVILTGLFILFFKFENEE